MPVTEIAFYSKEICDYVSANADKVLSKKQSENLYKFLTSIEKEAASGFWTSFAVECPKASAAWYKADITVEGKTGHLVQDYMLIILSKKLAMK